MVSIRLSADPLWSGCRPSVERLKGMVGCTGEALARLEGDLDQRPVVQVERLNNTLRNAPVGVNREHPIAGANALDDGGRAVRHGDPGASGEATAAERQYQVQRRLRLDVVVRQRAAILELRAREDQTLQVKRYALRVPDLGLDVLNRVAGFACMYVCMYLDSQGQICHSDTHDDVP